MFLSLMALLFGTSSATLNFIFGNRRLYMQKLLIILPITAWTAILYQINPLFVKWGIEAITDKWTSIGGLQLGNTLMVLAILAGTMLVLTLTDHILTYIQGNILQKLDHKTEAFLEDSFTKFLTRFDSSFLGAENNMRLVTDIQWKLNEIEPKITEIIKKIVEILAGIATFIAILPLLHPYLIVIIAITAVFGLIIENIQGESWRRFDLIASRQNQERSQLKGWIIYYFGRTVASGWIHSLYQTYQERRTKSFQTRFQQNQVGRKFEMVNNIGQTISGVSSDLLAGWLVLTGSISLGTFAVFGSYTYRLKAFFQQMGDIIKKILEIRFEFMKIDFLINLKPKLDYTDIQTFVAKDIQKITISDLCFNYPKFYAEEKLYLEKMKEKLKGLNDEKKSDNIFVGFANRMLTGSLGGWGRRELRKSLREIEEVLEKSEENKTILNQVNYTFEKGQIYALVGYNGAGKTTLTKLIKRSLDPTLGEIEIISDNKATKLKNIEPMEWKKYLSSLEQTTLIWPSLTIRSNLLLGKNEDQEISDETMLIALEKVGLDKEIKNLDMIVGENIELSGGQEQLLELARVYVQKKPIIILDEGTNQLDAVKEAKVIELLQEIKLNSIIIFITHRMTTCNRCDQVLVLENGEIMAAGKPSELLNTEKPNLYKTFWQLQVGEN